MRIPLANLLARNPLSRLEELMDAVVVCTGTVPRVIEALIRGDQREVADLAREMSVLEGQVDQVKTRVRARMPTSLLLPVDRRDVLRLIGEIDAIADCAEDVGVLLSLRPLDVPDEMETVLRLFVERIMDCIDTAHELVRKMETLVELGFSRRVTQEVLTFSDSLGRKEHEADKLQDQCAKILFRCEEEMDPVAVFMWTKVLNKLGDMANHAENVGDQFRLFVAR